MQTLMIFAFVIFATSAIADTFPQNDQAMQRWEIMPEDPAMKPVCALTLQQSIAIEALLKKHASVIEQIRWAEIESEKIAKLSNDQLMPIGNELVLMHLLLHAHFDKPIYQHVKGGFPRWAYRSCLKGDELK